MADNTVLYQIGETSPYMMSFVIITKNDNAIVIDGGRKEDMARLKEVLGGRHISAWILTHAHIDHIDGFVFEMQENGGRDFDIEKVYYNFLPYEPQREDVWDREYYLEEINEMLPSFLEIEKKIKDRAHIVKKGDSIGIDEVKIDFLYTYHRFLTSNPLNDSSLVFRLSANGKSILFLGDLGPEGGDVLFEESRHLLKSDMVQMAHHGHMNCSMEVYEAIGAKICFWCCPKWLYDEDEVPKYLSDRERQRRMGRSRMYGTKVTRKWMESLGAKTHYVTMGNTNKVILG